MMIPFIENRYHLLSAENGVFRQSLDICCRWLTENVHGLKVSERTFRDGLIEVRIMPWVVAMGWVMISWFAAYKAFQFHHRPNGFDPPPGQSIWEMPTNDFLQHLVSPIAVTLTVLLLPTAMGIFHIISFKAKRRKSILEYKRIREAYLTDRDSENPMSQMEIRETLTNRLCPELSTEEPGD